jgi:uncharacterized SAM-binding protein YcdF (DUF218 family)
MLFGLKKFIGYWIAPVPACLALLVVGLLVLVFTRRAKLGRILIAAGVLLLALFSNKTVSRWLIWPLETRYAAIPELSAGAPVPPALAACRYVVVLGAGNGNTPGLAALDQLSDSARGRVAEAVRLLRALPDARLLVSGPAEGRSLSHATKLEQAAVSLGIDRARIVRIETARDTEDESLAVRKLAGDAPVAVVTSAWHMPRAAALFRSAGVNALPCPADYSAHFDGEFRDVA